MGYVDMVATPGQTLAPNTALTYGANDAQGIYCNGGVTHVAGSSVVGIAKCGAYKIVANTVLTSSATGTLTLQLYNGSTPIPGAVSSLTVASGDTYSMVIDKIIKIRPSCCAIDNSASISLLVTDGNGTIVDGNMSVFKVA